MTKQREVFTQLANDAYDKELKIKYVDFKTQMLSKKKLKEITPDGEDVNIVGYVKKSDKKIKNDTYGLCNVQVEDQETQLNVYDKKPFLSRTLGYIEVGNNEYLEVRGHIFAFILLFFGIIILCGLLLTQCGTGEPSGKPNDGSNSGDINIAQGEDFDGNIDNGYKAPEVSDEQIKVQGKSTIYIREGDTVDLVNPADNTVYFKYTVVLGDEVLYEMDEWIAPGQKVSWKAYEYLTKPGEYTISYQIATKDIETHDDCNAVNINGITAIVE